MSSGVYVKLKLWYDLTLKNVAGVWFDTILFSLCVHKI